jgi:hypothetical protein
VSFHIGLVLLLQTEVLPPHSPKPASVKRAHPRSEIDL